MRKADEFARVFGALKKLMQPLARRMTVLARPVGAGDRREAVRGHRQRPSRKQH